MTLEQSKTEYVDALAERLCDELDMCDDTTDRLADVDEDIVLEWMGEAAGYAAGEWLKKPEDLSAQELADATDLEEVVAELKAME